ncbi:NfeD family protein, partial [Leptolyngbya cf. ectocarpi LEGE 11479]
VIETIKPGKAGRIKVHGIFWPARSVSGMHQAIPTGTDVSIIARDNITLLVHPVTPLFPIPPLYPLAQGAINTLDQSA